MRVFRIALLRFGAITAEAFNGVSGFSADGRWHTSGHYLDYAAESRSLATLERLVHYKRFNCLHPHVIYALEIPDRHIEAVATPPHGWDGDDLLPDAQAIGDKWCEERRNPGLRVPSAVTPGEQNLLLNARHPDWDWKWVVSGPKVFRFDARLVELMSEGSRGSRLRKELARERKAGTVRRVSSIADLKE